MTAQSPALFIVDYLIGLPDAILNGFSDEDPTMGRMVFLDGLLTVVKGTGKRALTVSSGPTAIYASGSQMYGGAVSIRCYADHTRLNDGTHPVDDGLSRAFASWGRLDLVLQKGTAPLVTNPWIQSNRNGNPLESYDPQQDLPYVTQTYDVSVMVSA